MDRPTAITNSLLIVLLLLLGTLAGLGCALPAPGDDGTQAADAKPLRFGLLSDVQYADKETAGKRRYRDSLLTLERCADDLRGRDLAFVVHCGDIIDGRETVEQSTEDLTRVLSLFERVDCEVRHVIGNHCLEVPREQLLPRLGLTEGHYSFACNGWRFIVVDALAFSVCGIQEVDPICRKAAKWLEQNAGAADFPNAQPWNGSLGVMQRSWLRRELAAAGANGEHAVIFSHLPVLASASTAQHLLWDHDKVFAILDEFPAFTAWINGHDHAGGFAERKGRSFVTIPAMVEADPETNAYAVCTIFPDRIEIDGVGNVPSRTIHVPSND